MSWDIKGTTGSLDSFPNVVYQSKVSAPKNPKLIKELKISRKVNHAFPSVFQIEF